MSKLSFRARALDASKPMPIYLAEELPDLPDYSAINRAVPQMPSGMEKEEECEHHLQRAICTGLIIPTPEVFEVNDLEFYERCYPPDYKMPKQHIHMQPLWQEQETPEYDIDSEDEKWLKQQRHPELTELKFEQMMDKLEKSSGQTVVTLNEAKLLLDRNDDLLIAVYDYWLNKRLKTQHPLILTVRTENRPGQSSNNPYLAFRRRTEKMQTRKNRKNDESSYEKMLKLRRDLARALTLLELVERRERVKRDLVRLTALLTEKRYHAGDFANHIADIPPRPQYTSVQIPSATFRREQFALQHYPPRAPPTPVDQPRIRERRAYKRARKYRHFAPGTATAHGLRDSGVCTSSDEESSRTDVTSPEDGPFAFKRKPGCYYEMPTSTLNGDPVEPTSPSKDGLYEHELDERTRYTLTSVNHPYPKCVGFARRRLARGGRIVLDRIRTPLDDLWTRLNFTFPHSKRSRVEKEEEMDLETKLHRNPKVITRDYHTSGKNPWRHAFRQHLRRNGHLWTDDVKTDADDVKIDIDDIRLDVGDVKMDISDVKSDISDVKFEIDDVKLDSDNKFSVLLPQEDKSDISVSARTIDGLVRDNLGNVMRKRAWSACSDSSYDSDESLKPVEKRFEQFVNEVNKKWLHFRPKTPLTPVEQKPTDEDTVPLTYDTPLTVELRFAEEPPSEALDPFVTEEFTLGQIYGDVITQDPDNSGSSLDITTDDLLTENFTGLTDAQVESILSDTDLKALADDKKPLPDDLLDELVRDVDAKSFLLQGQSQDGRAGSGQRKRKEAFGSSVVHTSADKEPAYVDTLPPPPVEVKLPTPAPKPKVNTPIKVKAEPATAVRKPDTPKPVRVKHEHAIESVPTSKIIVEEVNEVPQPQIKVEKKRSVESIEELQLSHGVHLKTVQTKHSPLKKHIITAATHRRVADVTVVTSQPAQESSHPQTIQPQIVTVAVSESLKAHLQSQIAAREAAGGGASGQMVGVVNNGPPALAVLPVPIHPHHATRVTAVSAASTSGGARRVSAPLVQLATGQMATASSQHKQQTILQHQQPVVVAHTHTIHQQPSNKLKVLHAHPLTQTQRTQLLAQNRSGLTQLPAVVSLATLGEAKGNTALIKGAGVAQFFEIKGGQLAKGPHLVNVVRQPAPGKTTVAARLDLNDVKKRQVVFDGTVKGAVSTPTRAHRVSVSLDGRQIVRAALPAAAVRQQLHLRNRTLQVANPQMRTASEASSSMTVTGAGGGALGHGVVASLVPVGMGVGVGGQKIALTGARQLAGSVQAIALSAAQLKARQARQPQHQPQQEIVEATPAPIATSSQAADTQMEASNEEAPSPNGTVRRRPNENLPMEVT